MNKHICSKDLDITSNSFFIIKIALIATTIFLLIEKQSVQTKWKTPLTVSALVTGIAGVHYHYMSNLWLTCKKNPISIRYIDWFLTVPLQLIEFYLILNLNNKVPRSVFFKLLILSIVMLIFGYLGEMNLINRNIGFFIGMISWLYILHTIYFGEAAVYYKKTQNKSVKFIFENLRLILLIGWSIYPIGYLLKSHINTIYNFGDLVNKILFGLVIWYGAKYRT